MVKKYHALPPSLFVNNIERDGSHALSGGGFADIYKGTLAGKTVCLKVLRVHTADSERKREKIIADFCQEALIWTQLQHPNLLPLLGVNTNLFSTSFCLVSPWMVNGDVISFLKKNPGHDKFRVVYEIACGLDYLHSLSPPIVHGDIKGPNILVDEYFRCCLADFGLADAAAETTVIHATSGVIKGSIRWMAPEMYAFTTGMNVDNKPKEDKSPRDIYAFACTILEIMTGKPPFHELIDPAVIYQVSVRHIRPERPSEGWCPNHIWNLVELCWHEDPSERPCAKALQSYLQSLLDAGNPSPEDAHFIGYYEPEDQPPPSPTPVEINFSETEPPRSAESSELPSPLPLGLPYDFQFRMAETDIRSPSSPSVIRSVTLFFEANEKFINEAVAVTSSSSPALQYWRFRDETRYVQVAGDNLWGNSYVFTTALEVLARLHPVIGVTVIAFKLNIASFYARRPLTLPIVTLMIGIQETMAVLLRLRHLADPEDRAIDGLTIWDRLQELLVKITIDIEGAGSFIEASLTHRTSTESSLTNRFVQWKDHLAQAFTFHPTWAQTVAPPSPQPEAHWESRMDDLVSQFQVHPLPSENGPRWENSSRSNEDSDVAERYGGHRMPYLSASSSELPGDLDHASHVLRQDGLTEQRSQQLIERYRRHQRGSVGNGLSAGGPQPPNADFQYVKRRQRLQPSLSSSSSGPYPPVQQFTGTGENDGGYTIPRHRSIMWAQPSNPTAVNTGFGELSNPSSQSLVPYYAPKPAAFGRPDPVPQVASQVLRPVGFYGGDRPPPTLPPELPSQRRILLHRWLSDTRERAEFTLDFSDGSFNPLEHPQPPNAPVAGGAIQLTMPQWRHKLEVAGTDPPLRTMRLVVDKGDFAQPPPWPPVFDVGRSSSFSHLTVTDILSGCYGFLNHRIQMPNWEALDERGREVVARAYTNRCKKTGDAAGGVRLVDYLGPRTKFFGIVQISDSNFRVLLYE
ncbi:hypothetical protein V5O48_007589 [Marasmius crinis-equi]|uniref:Protein kinase domain-containing protein n=1 Tax=Marasmius crinis-equi TaxID=585013 RepID=A0ABR3FGZ8_9AGAR